MSHRRPRLRWSSTGRYRWMKSFSDNSTYARRCRAGICTAQLVRLACNNFIIIYFIFISAIHQLPDVLLLTDLYYGIVRVSLARDKWQIGNHLERLMWLLRSNRRKHQNHNIIEFLRFILNEVLKLENIL